MSDLTERIRWYVSGRTPMVTMETLSEAADRIEVLEAEVARAWSAWRRSSSLAMEQGLEEGRLRRELAAARAERDGLAKALDELGRYADDSIGTAYGTISASWLRRFVDAALPTTPEQEVPDELP